MDHPREGGSSTRPPWFDGSNYAYWKVRMRAHLISQNVNVWLAIEAGWSKPTHTVDGVTAEKSMETWTRAEQERAEWNYKALSAIFCAVSADEFRRISSCEIAKEAWTILELTHEGNSTVKKSKLQKITSGFENLKMADDETFDQFYAKLSDLVNSSFNLGEPIPNRKIVSKILRSLPISFQAKVTAIEEARDVDSMKVEDLVGSLQTYESNMIKPKKMKGVALKTIKETDTSSSDDSMPSIEEVALYTKKIRKFFKKKDENAGKIKKNEKFKGEKSFVPKKKDQKSKGVKCYECQGYGHIAQDCGNKKNKKKVLNATLDDSDESSTSSSSEDFPENYTAFMARSSTSANSKDDNEEESEKEIEDEEAEKEIDLEDAYEQLFQDCRKFHKKNEKLSVMNKVLKTERDSLKSALEELQKKFEELQENAKTKSHNLEARIHRVEEEKRTQERIVEALREKLAGKDKECFEAQSALQKLNEKMRIPSNNLQQLLEAQRSPSDKRGLGYTGKKETRVEPSTSEQKKIQAQKTSAPQKSKVPPPAIKQKKGNP